MKKFKRFIIKFMDIRIHVAWNGTHLLVFLDQGMSKKERVRAKYFARTLERKGVKAELVEIPF